MEDCINRYGEALDKLENQIEKYNSVQVYAKGFKDNLSEKIAKIRNGKFEPTYTSYGAPEYFDIKHYVDSMVKAFYRDKIHSGVDGKIIYNDELLNSIARLRTLQMILLWRLIKSTSNRSQTMKH